MSPIWVSTVSLLLVSLTLHITTSMIISKSLDTSGQDAIPTTTSWIAPEFYGNDIPIKGNYPFVRNSRQPHQNYMGFGHGHTFMRLGRGSDLIYPRESGTNDLSKDESELMLRTRRDPAHNFMRFGRALEHNFMRFGRAKDVQIDVPRSPKYNEEINAAVGDSRLQQDNDKH